MGILGYFRQGSSHPIHRDFIKKELRIFRNFLPKGGGGLANSEISLSEKTGASELLEGGVSEFRSFSEKKKQFFFMPPLTDSDISF